MNQAVTADQLVADTSIANRAMKAVLHRGVGAGRRSRDTAAEALVKQAVGDEGQIVTRKLFTDKQNPIHHRNQVAQEMYEYHMHYTLPHGDDGSRLLPNTLYMDYVQKMSDFKSRVDSLDQYIIANYDDLVRADVAARNAALINQNKPATASTSDYPTAHQMSRYLYVEWHLEPIATENDFRYQVDEHVKTQLKERLDWVRVNAKREIYTQMLEPVVKFIDKMSVPIGEDGSVFRNSLVENINEMVTRLPRLNFDNDPIVAATLAEIEQVIRPYVFNPDILREQPESRAGVKAKMEALASKLAGYQL